MIHAAKALLKSVLPSPVADRWKRYRFDREQAEARGKPLAAVFSEIYEHNVWATPTGGARYCSGPGSRPEVTRGYEDFVIGYIESRPETRRLVDIGCGDFQVASRILGRLSRPIEYVGCDIARNVVAYNEAHHARPGVRFMALDVTSDPLPEGDLVTVREVFQHLSNDRIEAALANLRRTFPRAIVTEMQPCRCDAPNLDIVSGYRTRDGLGSGVYLDLPPFGLTVLDEYVMPVSANEHLRSALVAL